MTAKAGRVDALLTRLGIAPGSLVDVEVLTPACRASGRVDSVVVDTTTGAVLALALTTDNGTVAVLPWHAIARVTVRPTADHPAL